MKKFVALCSLLSLIALTGWATPQSKTKKQKSQSAASDVNFNMPISDQIDHDIGEMLGAWQVGDVEAMHKYYADDATWVSGAYAEPVVGWQNYVQQYLQERKAFTSIQLIRRNTNVFHYGDTAWACYQWEFDGLSGDRTVTGRGQTTLVFVKKGDQWLIVHNHTSQICPGS